MDSSNIDENMISKKWYDFLDSLNEKLSEYEIQKNRIYNVAVIEDWENPGKKQRLEINKHNFGEILSKIEASKLAGYDEIRDIALNDQHFEELNYVLRSNLDYEVYVECIEPFLLIKGNYISIGEHVNHVLQSIRDRKNAFCSSSVLEKLKYVNIFALDTLFIDQDVELPGFEYPISLIAPKWDIIGNRRINLNGVDGKMDFGSLTVSSTHSMDGDAGKPGGPGGYLFGIAAQILNGANFTITANGGEGGSGGNGKNGKSGKEGLSPWKLLNNTPEHLYDLCVANKKVDSFSCEETSFYSTLGDSVTFKIYGESGTKGGDGGNGGKGGKGGRPGTIKIFELNSNSKISKSNHKGADGKNGRGGIGGIGGKNGDDVVIRPAAVKREKTRSYSFGDSFFKRFFEFPSSSKPAAEENEKTWSNFFSFPSFSDFFKFPFNTKPYNWKKGTTYTTWVKERHINNGRSSSGKNGIDGAIIGNLQESKKRVVMDGEEAKILNEYKKYLRENMNDCFKKLSLIQFLNQMERSDEVNKIYNTFNLARELQDLEMQFPKLHNEVDFEPFYQSLLKRVDEYAKNPMHKEILNEYKKVLAYIYTATLSRIYNLKDVTESNLVIDINGYLNLVKKNIEELKDLQKLKNKAVTINRYKENFKNHIDSIIKETSLFIEQKISPEIDKIGTQIDRKIELLIKETIKLKNQAKQEHEKLKNLKLELQKALELRGFFNCFKIIGQVVSFLGPYGEIAGKIIGGVSKISESLVIDYKNEFNTLELSKEVLYEILSKIVKIKNIQESVDLFAKKDHTTLDLIDENIEEMEQKYEILKQFEEYVYENIIPMMKNMTNELNEVANKLSTKSKVSFSVTQWQIQRNLRDLKLRMKQQTESLKGVEDDLTRCLEKLEEAMSSLINVYNHIQNYQEQHNLANYVADISSTMASSIVVKDSKLSLTVTDLERVIRSNMIIKEYKIALNAFKQFVFPFAHIYLKKLKLPSSFEEEKFFENLITEAVTQIESIALQVHIYKTSVKGHDQNIFTGEFTSNYISTQPFFVWRKEHYKDILSKLLSGQEVVLKADVRNSPIKKDAIKFSSIDLNFKAQNKTIQYEINNKIKGFGVKATHLGNSYYRYQDKYYLITSDSQTIAYSFEKNDAGEPASKNKVYDKIKNGDLMLSPYAVWKIKLIDYANNIPFSDLEIYSNQVDLELVGIGSYIYNEIDGLDLWVESYYRTVDGYHTQKLKTELNSTSYLCSLKNKKAKHYKSGITVNPEFPSYNNPNAKSSIKSSKESENNSWFSWLRLPSFSIFQGADAVLLKKNNERNKAKFDCWNCLDNLEQSELLSTHQENLFLEEVEEHGELLMNEAKSFHEEVEPNISKLFTDNMGSTTNDRQNVLELYLEKVMRKEAIAGISFSSERIKKGNVLHTRNMIDLSHNLFFGQLVTHKLYGKNKLLNSIDYTSPVQEHEMKINKLTSKVLPIIAVDEWYDDERQNY